MIISGLRKNTTSVIYSTIKSSGIIAVSSFLMGTLILLIFMMIESPAIMIFGIIYIFIAAIINLIFFSSVIYKKAKDYISTKETLISLGIILSNLPIIYLYFQISTTIMKTWFD